MDDEHREGPSRKKRRYRLRYLDQDIKLRPGGIVFGRDPRCDVVFQDSQVSRRHARIHADESGIYVEDLKSANGVQVNGERIGERRRLRVGDRIKIGRQQLTMIATEEDSSPHSNRSTKPPPRDGSLPAPQSYQPTLADLLQDTGSHDLPSSNVHLVNLLGDAAEEVLATGGARTAEALLRNHLQDLLLGAKARGDTSGDQRDWASRYALKLAGATKKGAWFDYVVELHLALRKPMPLPLIDDMFMALRGVSAVNVDLLAEYLDAVQGRGDVEPLSVERLRALKRLAELK